MANTKTTEPTRRNIPRNPKLVFASTGVFSLGEMKHKVEYIWTSRLPRQIHGMCAAVGAMYDVVRNIENRSPKPDRNGVEDKVREDLSRVFDSLPRTDAARPRSRKGGGAQ